MDDLHGRSSSGAMLLIYSASIHGSGDGQGCPYLLDCRGLNIWDEAERIGKITEEDLLNGAKDWRQYSRDGHSLIYNKDICHRCCSWENWEQLQDGKLPPNS